MNFKEFYLHKPFKSSLLFLATALSSLLLVGSSYALTLEFNALRSRQALIFAKMLGLQLSCLLFSALLAYYSNLTLEKLIQSYLQQIRQDVALHLFNDEQAHDPAQAQNQLLKEEDLLSINYLRNIYSAFKSGVTVLAAGGALLSFHWSLFIACLIFALMQIYLPRLLDRQLNQANQKMAAQNQAYLKVLGDWLLGLGDLHRCLSLAWFKEKAGLAAKKLEDAHVHKSAVSTRLDYLNQLAYSLGSSLILLLTAFLVIRHWTAFGLLSSIDSFNSDFFGNLQNAANYLGEISGSRKLRHDLLAQRTPVPEQTENGQAPAGFSSSPLTVEFADLTLTYPAIKLAPGEKVLLSGTSGSGKSTFFKLLLGELSPASGTIHYLDQNSQTIQPNLSQIGYLPQDPRLFPGSIAENMTMFNPALSDPELLLQTAEQVNLSEDLRLWPDGLNTRVAVEDSNISGGQRQKIVLARSYLYHSQLLLVDEGTSAIDQDATREIILRLLQTDKTILFIAHNLTTEIRQLFDREIKFD
ncbi:ATP-binding cassette domain-containing protein [Lactobacillus porci]|uniref:ATP-binding cassette domain-containing protein n=1 Tax=Lactobacillus porci TaxID=2012477 RepID=UPI0039957BDC